MNIPEGKHLGVLCKRGHEWENSGKSLRYNTSRGCIKCVIERGQTPKYKEVKRLYGKRNRKELSRKQRLNKIASGSGAKYYKRHRKRLLLDGKYYMLYKGGNEIRRVTEAGRRDTLNDNYVKNVIHGDCGIPIRDIPQELVVLKREQLKLHRLIKEKINGEKN